MTSQPYASRPMLEGGDIPIVLRDLGVTQIIKETSGYDAAYELTFSDGDSFWYSQSYRRLSNQLRNGDELIQAIADAIRLRRHLPFDERGGAE